jgi:tRNA 2-thiouridine synthesizing protein A
MIRVLEELKGLQPGQRLEVFHERRPMFLYPQLDDRGFSHATDEPEPGVVRIVIQRPGAER